jgi:hypothetical protein
MVGPGINNRETTDAVLPDNQLSSDDRPIRNVPLR